MIDIGVNLTNSQLINKAQEVLNRARSVGVEHCVITGTDIDSSRQAIQLIEELGSEFHPMLSCTAGVHPHDAKDWDSQSAANILECAEHPRVVAIGETGLDFNRNYSPQAQQISAFEAQIELAAETGKPLFLHERDAYKKQWEILHSYRDSFNEAVIHCFTGDKESLFSYLDLDMHIGITGWICDPKRGEDLATIVSNIPLDRLMAETDAPFLLPKNIEPKPESRTNEPMYLPWVLQKIALCYGVEPKIIEASTTEVARRFFKLTG